MMMMMVVMSSIGVMDGAILFVAMLTRGFELKRCVRDAVFCEFLADSFFDVVRVSLGYHMERCVVVVPVHTPHVDVVNVLHAFDVAEVLAKFGNFDAVRRFFEEEVKRFFEVANGIDKDKRRNADRHQGVDDGNIGKAHNDGSNKNNEPAEDVLKHMQVDRLLVERIPFPCEECREEVDRRADDGKDNHPIIVDGCGVNDAHNGVINNENRAHQEDKRSQDTTDNRVTRVTVGVVLIGLFFALLFKKIGCSNACGISDIVHGIGYDGNAARKKAAYKFKYRKSQIKDKCN